MKIVIGVLAAALGWTIYAVSYLHPAPGPEATTVERKVEGNTLISDTTPRVRVTVDRKFQRKRNTTIEAKIEPTIRCSSIECSEFSINIELSPMISIW